MLFLLLSLLSMIVVISVVAGLVTSVLIIIVCVLSEVFSDSDGDGAKKEIRPNAVLLVKIRFFVVFFILIHRLFVHFLH